ncbi:MAG: hypothetical protein HY269_01530 [Deltaproteobacteria bacterium]|nr:hypothetical protein [Deltaproteobacteria bacterium]
MPPLRALLEAGLLRDLAIRNAVNMPEAEIYAFTHTVFYGTNYGRDISLFAEIGRLASLRADTLVLLDEMRTRGHWDLVAELVLAWRNLGGGGRLSVDHAWQALSDTQRADGSFPATDETSIQDEADPGRNRALRRYHVCLVAALAAFASCKQR